MSIRWVLTDEQWAKMEPQCLGKPSDPGRSGTDNRRFVEAVLWIARTGSPWRDLPPEFGKWNTVFKRFRDWVKADVFQRLFDAGVYVVTITDANGCTGTASGTVASTGVIPPTPGPITGPAGACRNTTGIVYSITPVPGATSF